MYLTHKLTAMTPNQYIMYSCIKDWNNFKRSLICFPNLFHGQLTYPRIKSVLTTSKEYLTVYLFISFAIESLKLNTSLMNPCINSYL